MVDFVTSLNQTFTKIKEDMKAKVSKGDLVINVRDYGAVGDGVIDDTVAIKAAATAAVAKGRHTQLLFPGTVGNAYRTTDTITLLGGVVPWMHAPILATNVAVPALVVGAAIAGHTVDRSIHQTMKIKVRRSAPTAWADEVNDVGVRLINCYYNTIFVDQASYFTIGIDCRADGGGFAYNKIHLGIMDDNKIALNLACYNVGWVNENSFYGGSFHVSSTTHDGLAGRTAKDRIGVRLGLGDGSYPNNNSNVWYHPSFEIYGEVSNLFTGIPIVAEACGLGNKFLDCRNELSEPIVAETRNLAYPVKVTMSYDSQVANPVLNEVGSYTGSVLERQHSNAADEAKRLVFSSGAIHKRVCYYDGATGINIPGMAIQTNSTLVDDARFGIGFTLGTDYLTVPVNRMIGVYVNTKKLKRFTLLADAEGNGGRFTVRAHLADGTRISTANAVRNDKSPMTYTTGFGGVWRTGTDSLRALHVSVPTEAEYAFIGITGGSNPALVRSFSIVALDSDIIPSTWLPWEDNNANFATTPPTAGTWERGRKIYNATPSVGGSTGWVCVTAGTPGTWMAMNSSGSATLPDVDFITDYNAVDVDARSWSIGAPTNGVSTNGAADIEITDSTKGVIMKSTNGTRYRLTVGNDGALTTTVVV